MMPDKNANWPTRKWESEWWTKAWMLFLKWEGHFHSFEQATLSEDKNDLIDYWVQFEEGGEWVPIQFKLRVDGRRDMPMSLRQPFYGCDVPYGNKPDIGLNMLGRDYRGLMKGKAKYHYIAVQNQNRLYNEIYRIDSDSLKTIVLGLEESWMNNVVEFETIENLEVRSPYLTYREDRLPRARVSTMFGWTTLFQDGQGEIGLLKNEREPFRKINCYVNESLKQNSFDIPKDVSLKIRQMFHQAKKDRVS
jgi:hypothetical protein